jgi:hypothetical protein
MKQDTVLVEDNDHNVDDPENFEGKRIDQFEEGCSFTSSNRESWGRCSSLGGTEEDESLTAGEGDQVEKTADVNTERKPRDSSREEEEEDSKEKKIKNGGETDAKKPRHEKLERLEAFSKRLRHYILKRVNHRRHRSP